MDCDRTPSSIWGKRGRNYGPTHTLPFPRLEMGPWHVNGRSCSHAHFFLKKVGSFIFWGGNCGGRMAEKGCWVDRFNYYWTQIPFFLSFPRKRNSHLRKKKRVGGRKTSRSRKTQKLGIFGHDNFWNFLKSSNCDWVGGNKTKIKFILSPFIFVNQFLKHPPVPNYFRHFPLPRWKSRKKTF